MYKVVLDSYDIAKDEVLARYARKRPERMPSTDSGRPTLTILVEFFCRVTYPSPWPCPWP